MNTPVNAFDPPGLYAEIVCRPVQVDAAPFAKYLMEKLAPVHCRVHVACCSETTEFDVNVGLEWSGKDPATNPSIYKVMYEPADETFAKKKWTKHPIWNFPTGDPSCPFQQCVLSSGLNYPRYPYSANDPNGNTFGASVINACGGFGVLSEECDWVEQKLNMQ